MSLPVWAQWTLRIAGWAAWQLVVPLFAFVVYANLFSEYGIYSHPVVDPLAAVVFLLLARIVMRCTTGRTAGEAEVAGGTCYRALSVSPITGE